MATRSEKENNVTTAARKTIVRRLPDGKRLHLQDGPIDIVLEAFGAPEQKEIAFRAAVARFNTILDELCAELPLLRERAHANLPVRGPIAQRMLAAVLPFAEVFITPMAAVAGAVADDLLSTMISNSKLGRAYVNDGGDIAFHLNYGETFKVGMIDRPDHPSLFGEIILESEQTARGLATSGWRGRSFSLGIADAVTVLARTAAMADAAATVVANAVDLPGHSGVTRAPARGLSPDSDLEWRLVTTSVGRLSSDDVNRALESGAICARDLLSRKLIVAAALHLQGTTCIVTTGSEPAFEKLAVQECPTYA
jgi:uncharacterized protein